MDYALCLFPDFSLIVCGFLVCRYTALNRPVWAQVESLVCYLLFAVLLFQSIVRRPLDLGAASSLIAEGLLLIGVRVPLFNVAALWPMARHANTGFVRELVTRSTMLGGVGLPFALGGLR